jgi:hypothetical protein
MPTIEYMLNIKPIFLFIKRILLLLFDKKTLKNRLLFKKIVLLPLKSSLNKMIQTVNNMQKGEKRTISQVNTDKIPIKLLELGCLPGNSIEIIEKAPFGDPIYLNINDSRLAIRKELAQYIEVETKINDN